MNKQFTKMNESKKDSIYAGYKRRPTTLYGAIVSLGVAVVGSIKMFTTGKGSFRANGMSINWDDKESSSSSSAKPEEPKNYFYAY